MMIFSPEKFSAEQKKLVDVARRFMDTSVDPETSKIESGEEGVLRDFVSKAGEQGLLASLIPAEYGGKGISVVDATIVAEAVGPSGAFSLALIAHTGIGMLPLLMFGNEGQKKKYIPEMAGGKIIGAFALTEKGTGSDAFSIETKATSGGDGKHYVLNGEKIYCSNGDIADIFTVFANVEGLGLTAFLVEKGSEGLSIGASPRKMGLDGANAVPLKFKDVRVPVENILGSPGDGKKIALSVLNLGRLKLAATCVGNSKRLLEEMVKTAKERKRFGKPIAFFELIRQKIARAACRTFILESLVYGLAGSLDEEIRQTSILAASEKFAAECAIAKVFGSETIDLVSDEAVQLAGGEGYMRGNPAERAYRDFRIDRIFEGTNEIVRLFIANAVLKKAITGSVPKWLGGQSFSGALSDCSVVLTRFKEDAIKVSTVALKTLGDGIRERQSVLSSIADMAVWIYALDSSLKRASVTGLTHHEDICAAVVCEAIPELYVRARQTLINATGGRVNTVSEINPLALDTDQLYGRIALEVMSSSC